jgi:hypothetical protein
MPLKSKFRSTNFFRRCPSKHLPPPIRSPQWYLNACALNADSCSCPPPETSGQSALCSTGSSSPESNPKSYNPGSQSWLILRRKRLRDSLSPKSRRRSCRRGQFLLWVPVESTKMESVSQWMSKLVTRYDPLLPHFDERFG